MNININDNGAVVIAVGAFVAFLPTITAGLQGRGSGMWALFAGMSNVTAALLFVFYPVACLFAWGLSWFFVLGAHSAARRTRYEQAMLSEMREQNRIARGEPAPSAGSKFWKALRRAP